MPDFNSMLPPGQRQNLAQPMNPGPGATPQSTLSNMMGNYQQNPVGPGYYGPASSSTSANSATSSPFLGNNATRNALNPGGSPNVPIPSAATATPAAANSLQQANANVAAQNGTPGYSGTTGASPYAPNFGGASNDSNVFTTNQYMQGLNQNAYANQANNGQAPAFTQDQFNNAWNQDMQPGANFNPGAFNQAMGTGGVNGTGMTAAQLQASGLDPVTGRPPQTQSTPNNPYNVQQIPNAPPQNYNPPQQQAPPQQQQPPTQQQQPPQQNSWQQLMQSIFGGSQGGPSGGGQYGYNPQTQSLGNNGMGAQGYGGYGVNPFANTGTIAPSMANFNFGGNGNPMSGNNYGQMGGVASLLNDVNQMRMGYGGLPAGYASQGYGSNPFQGFSPFMGGGGFGGDSNTTATTNGGGYGWQGTAMQGGGMEQGGFAGNQGYNPYNQTNQGGMGGGNNMTFGQGAGFNPQNGQQMQVPYGYSDNGQPAQLTNGMQTPFQQPQQQQQQTGPMPSFNPMNGNNVW